MSAEKGAPSVRLYVRGMHCPSCEMMVESRLRSQSGILGAKASFRDGTVVFETNCPEKWTPEALGDLFRDQGYRFSREEPSKGSRVAALLGILGVVGVIVLSARWDLGALIDLSPTSSLGMVALFGVLAGCSSCAALVGGMVWALAPRWRGKGAHGAFAAGRLGAYLVGGALLGGLGAEVRPSPMLSSVLVFGVALVMAGLGLSMMGLPGWHALPLPGGRMGRRFLEAQGLSDKGPWLAGVVSLFLPCGFSLTVQGLALVSGSPWRGAALMGVFALGTLPSLAIIGLSGASWGGAPRAWGRRVAGALAVAAAVWSANTQLNVLGVPSLSDLGRPVAASPEISPSPVDSGPQELTMEVGGRGYSPRHFTVKAGVPVRWHIVDRGFSGCTNAIQAPGLFDGVLPLVRGGTATVEFTPESPGTYKFACWMGMATGEIQVE